MNVSLYMLRTGQCSRCLSAVALVVAVAPATVPAAAAEPAIEDRSGLYAPGAAERPAWTRPQAPVPAAPGPHLFVDDWLIETSARLERIVLPPKRDPAIPNPIVTGPEDRCFQPYFTVLRSPETGRFRIWYGAWREDRATDRSFLACMESSDGIHWERPPRICRTPEIQFGSDVIDRGTQWADPPTRYLYSYWLGGGLRVAVSADGIEWTPLADRVLLPHDHDINNLWWDPLRGRYVATISTYMESPRWTGRRRTTMQSHSADLLDWAPPAYVLYADPAGGDQGDTQFYGMSGYLARGPLVIGMAKVLRDDLTAAGVDPGAYGWGYTVLAWTRDGAHWQRDPTPFFEPDPQPGAWDHAHAWIDEQLLMDGSTYLYYGGYRQGHKMNRFAERQIGLVTMTRDRYVARRAGGGEPGRLRTVPIAMNLAPAALTLNADAARGQVRVAVLDAATGAPIPGLDLDACRPVSADGIDLAVEWEGGGEPTRARLAALAGRAIRLEFALRDADLFGFDLQSPNRLRKGD